MNLLTPQFKILYVDPHHTAGAKLRKVARSLLQDTTALG